MLIEKLLVAFQNLFDWVWLAFIFPIGLIFFKFTQKLLQKYLDSFETALAPYIESSSQNLAKWIFNSLPRYFAFRFIDKYYLYLKQSCENYNIQGMTIRGPYTLKMDDVYVPLRLSPETPHNANADLLKKDESDKININILNILARTNQDNRCIAILGPPGSGKTTLLEHLVLVLSKKNKNNSSLNLMPVLLRLRENQKQIVENQDIKVSDLIQGELLRNAELKSPVHWFERRLKNNNCLVMLDGLDEVADTEHRGLIASWVNKQIGVYPKSKFIVTSRPHGYSNNQIKFIDIILEIQSFDLDDIKRFLDKWYEQIEIRDHRRTNQIIIKKARLSAKDLLERICKYPTLSAMAANPLLLSMIATLHKYKGFLPENRVSLYDEICNLLLANRQYSKGLTVNLNAKQQRRILQSLAIKLMENKCLSCNTNQGAQYINERLQFVCGDSNKADLFLDQVEKTSGLIIQRQIGKYEFIHKSFQEYLTSIEIYEEKNSDYFLDKISDVWWEETLLLYSSQPVDISKIMEFISKNITAYNLTIASDIINNGAEISAEIRKKFQELIDDGIDSSDYDRVKLATHVKLSERIKNLIHIDKYCVIDRRFISNAEYQLFLNEYYSKNTTINHITINNNSNVTGQGINSNKFKSLIGVKFSEAKKFCEWLTKLNINKEVGINFRLPTRSEAEKVPPSVPNISCWCEEEYGDQLISGIQTSGVQIILDKYKDIILESIKNNIIEDLSKLNTITTKFASALIRVRELINEILLNQHISSNNDEYGFVKINDNLLEATNLLSFQYVKVKPSSIPYNKYDDRELMIYARIISHITLNKDVKIFETYTDCNRFLSYDFNLVVDRICILFEIFKLACDRLIEISYLNSKHSNEFNSKKKHKLIIDKITKFQSDFNMDIRKVFDFKKSENLNNGINLILNIGMQNFITKTCNDLIDFIQKNYIDTFRFSSRFDVEIAGNLANIFNIPVSFYLEKEGDNYSDSYLSFRKATAWAILSNFAIFIESKNKSNNTNNMLTLIALYGFLTIIELRDKNELPKWEGIRIVKEQIVTGNNSISDY